MDRQFRFNAWNRAGAQGRCTGMTLRDGRGREVGGRFRMRDTCTPMADSCQCMAKPTEIFYDRSIIKGNMAFHKFKSTDRF